jgi:DNA-binding response OmpR family regulator
MKKNMETNLLAVSKKILIVDDDPYIREIIMMILKLEGYNVAELDNGEAVVKTVHEIRPDVILLDIQLGDIDGRDICRELKDHTATQDIPVIIISGNQSWQALLGNECNADGFLTKPFEMKELVDNIRQFAA